jgi:uncharacterized membrane protein YbhN (UPF0104 family)
MASWKEIVRSIAPTLGTALGGPMAGAATKFIADKMLGKENATQDEIQEAILSASPEQLTKLKELDNQFKVNMKNLEIDVYELEYKDRDSARKLFAVNIWPQITLSTVFVLGYFGVLYFLMHGTGDVQSLVNNPTMIGVFTTILGVLTAAIPQILNFWFGSSLGSKEKTNSMNQTVQNANARKY